MVDGLGNTHKDNEINGHSEGISPHMNEQWFYSHRNIGYGNGNGGICDAMEDDVIAMKDNDITMMDVMDAIRDDAVAITTQMVFHKFLALSYTTKHG